MQIENGIFGSYSSSRTQASGRGSVTLGDNFAGILERKGPDASQGARPPSMPDDLLASQASVDATIADETDADLSAKARHGALVAELSKFASMSPAEMMRAKYLAAHGMTEASLRSMSSDDRAVIEKDIADYIKRSLSDKDGESAVSDVPQTGDAGGNSQGEPDTGHK